MMHLVPPSPPVTTDRSVTGIAGVRLTRAERGNALSEELVEDLFAAVASACADSSVHTLVLSGAGANLCTGFDLEGLDLATDGELLARFVRIETLLAMLWHAPVRTVALASGRTWGAGADLFAVCDLRIAHADTTFRFPGAGFGLVLGTRRLAERVGVDQARRWVIEGAQIDASQALAAGLATEVVNAEPGGDPIATQGALFGAPAVDRQTAAALRAATRADHRDQDLAALVRSAAQPGLQRRIAAYRDRMRRARG